MNTILQKIKALTNWSSNPAFQAGDVSNQRHRKQTPVALFGDTELIVEYKVESSGTEIEQFTCTHCGRQFFPYIEADGTEGKKTFKAIEKVRQSLMLGCPSNDCPSHWEAQGVGNPGYNPEGDPEQGLIAPDEAKLSAAGYIYILR